MTKKRPIGITILAVLAALGGVAAIFHMLQLLGLFPIKLGDGAFEFYTVNWLGSLMWAILAAIYLWLARGLWRIDPQAWLFLVVLAIINLIFDAISILGGMSWQDMMWSIVINVIILIYCLMPGVKEVFSSGGFDLDAPDA